MLKDFLTRNGLKSQAKFVEYGFGQVEPNHLSAQRTAQIYAQLPAKSDIDILENGQFMKYNYKDGVADFEGAGEWMLVFNEIKLYEDENDCEFAMHKANYSAKVYSMQEDPDFTDAKSRDYSGITTPENIRDPYATTDPFHIQPTLKPKDMPEGTTMVPRLFKTNVGDIFTTNMVNEDSLAVGDVIAPEAANKGILSKSGDTAAMQWQVVKVYTMPDRQKAVKIMRIA